MKKIILSTALATSCMFAVDIKPFIGLDMTSISAKHEIIVVESSGTTFLENELDDVSLGLKVGALIGKNHRIYLSYIKSTLTNNNPNNKIKLTLPAINYDYLIPSRNNNVSYMLGGHIGYGTVNMDSLTALHSDLEVDESSINYGIQAGMLFDINQNISLELGVKVTFIDVETSTDVVIAGIGSGTITQNITNPSTLYFGINYKF